MGYRHTKPMVNVCGRALLFHIIDNLSLQKDDLLCVAVWACTGFSCDFVRKRSFSKVNKDPEEGFRILDAIEKEYPQLNLRRVILPFQTRGAAETLVVPFAGNMRNDMQNRCVVLFLFVVPSAQRVVRNGIKTQNSLRRL
jgi:hypothetical protein